MLIKPDAQNRFPDVHLVRPDGQKVALSLHTQKDEELALSTANNFARVNLADVQAVKSGLVLDAADGKLDFKAGGFDLQRPAYTTFWTNNSAALLMRRLAYGEREMVVNGKKVEITQGFKDWVRSTEGLERVGAPIGG